MKRWCILLGIAALMAIGALIAERWLSEPKRRLAQYHQIELGMTKAEVVAIMGEGRDVVFTEVEWDSFWSKKKGPSIIWCGGGSPGRKTYKFYFVVDEDSIVIDKWMNHY